LFVLDDSKLLDHFNGPDLAVSPFVTRFQSLPAKYNWLLRMATKWGADIALVWEDDDIYLPWHISSYVECMNGQWAHPNKVWSLYTGQLELESAAGRFHASLGFDMGFIKSVGEWPLTQRADFDQQLLYRLTAASQPNRPDDHRVPSYVYRWGSTHADHGSGRMKGPEDTQWYDNTPIAESPLRGPLTENMDDETVRTYQHFQVAKS